MRAMLRNGLLLLPLLAIAACQSPTPPDLTAPRPIATTPAVPAASPALSLPLPKDSKINLTFTVQSDRSTGAIQTTLNPDGATLGPRTSSCKCPLRGRIRARLTTDDDGGQALAFEEVDLATTSDGQFLYKWSPFIGNITTTIPAGILRITDHHIPGPSALRPDGTFLTPGLKFSVDCAGDIEGRGIVLSQAVGKYTSRLDIPVTELVNVSGSLTRSADEFILHIPAAVLQDNYKLDGAALNLVFTGDITATAPVR